MTLFPRSVDRALSVVRRSRFIHSILFVFFVFIRSGSHPQSVNNPVVCD